MDDPARLMRFVLELRQQGLTHARVLSAMERTPRDHYAPAHLEQLAWEDLNLPLPHEQSMTKPSIVARMLAALDPQPGDVVLEVGTGSGYQSAVLALLARKVVTLDRWSDLLAAARARIGEARQMNVYAHAGDGFVGRAEDAPYDRIIVAGAVEDVPATLRAQLKSGGVLVAAVGERLVRRKGETVEDLGAVELPPLVPGLATE